MPAGFTTLPPILTCCRWCFGMALTKMVADGNGNYELMDTAVANNPGGFATVRQ